MRELRADGVTIILTTHYIEEAEEIADRVGIISGGRIILVEEKTSLMRKMGKKLLTLDLQDSLSAIPDSLEAYGLSLESEGGQLVYTYDTQAERTGVTSLLRDLSQAGIKVRDLKTSQNSLEDIFVSLVNT